MSEKPRALMLLGPTACGKTAVSLMLARDFAAEIISVDSALIYRGMDIGTAKPTKEEQGGVPHHLIDILDIEESYSAAAFAEDAERSSERSRGAVVTLCWWAARCCMPKP